MIRTRKSILYLSAHHDDMVYSSAITIRQLLKRGCQVANLNLFTISGWHATKALLNIEEVSKIRLEEERKMSIEMGYYTLSVGLPDSFSRGLNAYQELTQCCDEQQAESFSVILRRYLKPFSYDFVFVPISAGNHIDHKYTRYLAEKNCDAGTFVYYEDMPYVATGVEISHLIPNNYTPIYFLGDYEAKLADIRVYDSQLEDKNLEVIRRYGYSLVKGHYAERIWVSQCQN